MNIYGAYFLRESVTIEEVFLTDCIILFLIELFRIGEVRVPFEFKILGKIYAIVALDDILCILALKIIRLLIILLR